jgi:hypothetical protein
VNTVMNLKEFHKMLRISSITKQLLDFHDELSFTELVTFVYSIFTGTVGRSDSCRAIASLELRNTT